MQADALPGTEALASLRMLGAAREVTGSAFLLETKRTRLLFDCGMFQGTRETWAQNRAALPYDPRSLDAIALTHAHLDHSGLLPRVIAEGFRGPVYSTSATADLARILLMDSGAIQEADTERLNRKLERRREPLRTPLYTQADAERAAERLERRDFEQRFQVGPDVWLRFCRAGHILGAASIEVWIAGREREFRLVISGDIGRAGAPLLRAPQTPEPADVVLMESTYGDRNHRATDDTLHELSGICGAAHEAGENVIIPVFAIGRAQEILHRLGGLESQGRIAPRPVYLDSPMAIDVTEIYRLHLDCFDPSERGLLQGQNGICQPKGLVFTRSWEESMQLNWQRGVITLAASGMCEAGRIRHHLRHNLWRPGAQIVIVGFQAQGTLGRALVEGATKVRIFDEEVAVAAKVHTLGGFSAHADQRGLLEWFEPLAASKPRLVLVHGEQDKQRAFQDALAQRYAVQADVPERGACLDLWEEGRSRWR